MQVVQFWKLGMWHLYRKKWNTDIMRKYRRSKWMCPHKEPMSKTNWWTWWSQRRLFVGLTLHNYTEMSFIIYLLFYWNRIDIWHYVSLKCTVCWFDMLIYCNIITTIALPGTSIMSHNYQFFFVVRAFKI